MMCHQTYFKNQKKCRVITEESDQQKVSANPIGLDTHTFVVRSANQIFGASDFDKKFGEQDRA